MGDFLLTPHNLSQHTAAQYHQQVQSTSSSPTPAVRGLWEPNSKQIVNKSYQDKRRNQNINKSPIKLNTSSSSSSSLLLRKPNHDSNARNQIRMNNVTNDRRNYEEKKNDSKFQEKEDDEGGGGGGGAVLSLDEVAYDRDLKWYNKASSERVRPELNKNGQFYHNMTKVTNHNMLEQKSLDQHYYNLDQRKISKEQELNKLIKNNEKQQQNKKNKKKKNQLNKKMNNKKNEEPTIILARRPSSLSNQPNTTTSLTSMDSGMDIGIDKLNVDAKEFVPAFSIPRPTVNAFGSASGGGRGVNVSGGGCFDGSGGKSQLKLEPTPIFDIDVSMSTMTKLREMNITPIKTIPVNNQSERTESLTLSNHEAHQITNNDNNNDSDDSDEEIIWSGVTR